MKNEAVMAEVIVVDDEPDISDMVELMLTLRGWIVKRALNRRVALQMIREDPDIHIVLLDYIMPGMRADDFLERIRQLNPKPKVILLTAAHRVAERAKMLGVDHYLQKPFDAEDVYDTIEQCMASKAS
jgi:CheY-like chemotaxis protein